MAPCEVLDPDPAAVNALTQMLQTMHRQLVVGAGEAPTVALVFVRRYVPLKFRVLRAPPECKEQGRAPLAARPGHDADALEAAWASERRLLDEFRTATARARRAADGPGRHTYCGRTWFVALMANCLGHLDSALGWLANGGTLPESPDVLSLEPDYMGCRQFLEMQTTATRAEGEGQAWWRRELHTADPWANEIPMGVWLADTGQRHLVPKEMAPALDFLSKDECLAETVTTDIACGLTHAVLASQGEEQLVDDAAAYYEDAALRLLLCDGCRYDGAGIYGVALDKVLWSLGFLRTARPGEGTPQAFASALRQFGAHPASWWRGALEDEQVLYGRQPGCPLAMRRLCVGMGGIWDQDVPRRGREPFALPSCQIDHEPTDFVRVEVLAEKDAGGCAWAPPDVVGLLLPMNTGLLNSLSHPTGLFSWLLPALFWFHGGAAAERLLGALWRRGGLAGPAPRLLRRDAVEVVLVTHVGVPAANPGAQVPRASAFRQLIALLSDRPVRTLSELGDECRCYHEAIWGHVESNLRAHGDLTIDFVAELRARLQRGFESPPREALLLGVARRGFSVWPRPGLRRALAEERGERVGVLLTQRLIRTTAVVKGAKKGISRNFTNYPELRNRLLALAEGAPRLRVMAGALERLPLATQLHVVLHHVEVMVQPFGAGLSWSTLMAQGTYVIELQQDGVAQTNFVSCFPVKLGGGEDPWWPPSNPHSEWGAWAARNRVNFACASKRPSLAHCARKLYPEKLDSPEVEADVEAVAALVSDAARRLRFR